MVVVLRGERHDRPTAAAPGSPPSAASRTCARSLARGRGGPACRCWSSGRRRWPTARRTGGSRRSTSGSARTAAEARRPVRARCTRRSRRAAVDGRGRPRRRLPPGRGGVRAARGPRAPVVAEWICWPRRSGAPAAAEQAAEQVAQRAAEHAAQPALLLPPCCPPCWPASPPRMLPSTSPSPPDCPPRPPRRRAASRGRTSRSARGSAAACPSGPEVVEAPPVVPSCRTTWPRWSPKTWPTIRSPSFSSTSSRFTPPSARSLSCWRTAEANDAAPPGSAVLAWMPPSSAGSACRVACSAVPSSTPSRAARSASGMRDRMSSTAVMNGNASGYSTPRPGDAAAGPAGHVPRPTLQSGQIRPSWSQIQSATRCNRTAPEGCNFPRLCTPVPSAPLPSTRENW